MNMRLTMSAHSITATMMNEVFLDFRIQRYVRQGVLRSVTQSPYFPYYVLGCLPFWASTYFEEWAKARSPVVATFSIAAFEALSNPTRYPQEFFWRLLLHTGLARSKNPLANHFAFNSAVMSCVHYNSRQQAEAFEILSVGAAALCIANFSAWSLLEVPFFFALGCADNMVREQLDMVLPTSSVQAASVVATAKAVVDFVSDSCVKGVASTPDLVNLVSNFLKLLYQQAAAGVKCLFNNFKSHSSEAIIASSGNLKLEQAPLPTKPDLDVSLVPVGRSLPSPSFDFNWRELPIVSHISNLSQNVISSFSYFASQVRCLGEWLLKVGAKGFRLGKISLFLVAGVSLVILIVYLSRRWRYVTYNDGPGQVDMTNRPTMGLLPPGLNYPMDYRHFPIANQDTAKERLEELAAILDNVQHCRFNICDDCGCMHSNCVCNIPQQNYFAALALLNIRRRKVDRDLIDLYRPRANRTFNVGDVFVLPTRANWLGQWLGPVCNPTVTLTCVMVIETGDNRPESERHIRPGNSRFAVFSQDVGMTVPFFKWIWRLNFPRVFLRFFGHPCRDLIVSEDLNRNTRRNCLSQKFSETVRGQLENTLSVPINDPAFIMVNVNPVKDTFFHVRAHHFGEFQKYADF